jgi:hypothetical protein
VNRPSAAAVSTPGRLPSVLPGYLFSIVAFRPRQNRNDGIEELPKLPPRNWTVGYGIPYLSAQVRVLPVIPKN